MGCPPQVNLENNLTFSICSHHPDTGALTNADANPSYRVYEDETTTPILTGTLARLDSANTTGFYSEQIACTAANGFETGKSYTVYIEAVVGGVTGGISFGFTVAAASGNGGTLSLTYTLTSSVDATPIEGATVELYAESGMVNILDSQVTNAFGVATFSNLNAGTYYLKRIKSGWTFVNPDTESVA